MNRITTAHSQSRPLLPKGVTSGATIPAPVTSLSSHVPPLQQRRRPGPHPAPVSRPQWPQRSITIRGGVPCRPVAAPVFVINPDGPIMKILKQGQHHMDIQPQFPPTGARTPGATARRWSTTACPEPPPRPGPLRIRDLGECRWRRPAEATGSLTHPHVSAGPLRAATGPGGGNLMARPGSDKESFVGLSSPQRWDVIVGRWELDRDCRLCCLGVDALGAHATLGGVSRAGQPATVSGAGFVPSKPHH